MHGEITIYKACFNLVKLHGEIRHDKLPSQANEIFRPENFKTLNWRKVYIVDN